MRKASCLPSAGGSAGQYQVGSAHGQSDFIRKDMSSEIFLYGQIQHIG